MGTAASSEGAATEGEVIGIEDRQETGVRTVLTDNAITHAKLSIKPGGKNKYVRNTACSPDPTFQYATNFCSD